jgi:AAA domain
LVIAVKDHTGNTAIATPDVEAAIAEIKRLEIDVMIVDPFVRSHELTENDNNHMDFAAALWAKIAHDTNCAILLLHHTRKGAVSGDMDSLRGGSAAASAARRVITIRTMTAEEAVKLGVNPDECRHYFCIDDAKSNLAPMATKASWFRMVSIPLANGTPDYPHGDNVQAVEPWTPPVPTASLTVEDIERVLALIEKGTEKGEQYSAAANATARSAARAVASVLEWDEARAKRLITDLISRGVLTTEDYENTNRKKTSGLQVVRSKVAGIKRDVLGEVFTMDDADTYDGATRH